MISYINFVCASKIVTDLHESWLTYSLSYLYQNILTVVINSISH